MPNSKYLYWDSNVFLSYLNGVPNRLKTISDLMQEVEEDAGSCILTSSDSIVEVTHILDEKTNGRLDPRVEEAIDALWQNYRLIKMIDNGHHISSIARNLIREALPNKWSLTPKDAVHLASAYWYNRHVHIIDEFHTYDKKLYKFGAMIGMHICEPYVQQHRF